METKGRPLNQQICSSSCGEITNITYPFRLTTDPVGCGDVDYEISCKRNRALLEFNSGNYYVKKISYDQRIVRLLDVNLSDRRCSLPSKSLSIDELFFDSRYRGMLLNTDVSFLRCSKKISDPDYREVPCLAGNSSSFFYAHYWNFRIVTLGDPVPEFCSVISKAPVVYEDVKNPSYETIQRMLASGFDLLWSVECRDCAEIGRGCVLDSIDTDKTLSIFKCESSGEENYLLHLVLALLTSIIYLIFGLMLIGRYIIAPLVVFVFLIHQYRTLRKGKYVNLGKPNEKNQLRRYSYEDILAMTDHFREKLGQGMFGSVYKGQLPGGGSVAVKILDDHNLSAEEFINGISSTISKIHHPNLVPFVGFCIEGSNRALVHEYMTNGSLDEVIFPKRGKINSLTWEKLDGIALGVARGIEYLHVHYHNHLDIKPENILLDKNFVPRISDIGLTKFTSKNYGFLSREARTKYMAPEVLSRNFSGVSEKSDVYSFGMLLLDIAAGGRRNVREMTRDLELPSWVYDALSEGRDSEVENVSDFVEEIVRKLCIVGFWCIQIKVSDRPSIAEVVEMLEGKFEHLPIPPNPFLSSSPSPPA